MTENCASATLQHLADYRSNVGPPGPATELKLVDVPEMMYTSDMELPSGEVCTRGGVVFSGYHKNAEATAETLDADGWLHTGDIGRWNADGTLSIIDRKKNIFKLAQGEYVASEKVEMVLGKSKFIGQPWVYGNSYTTQLVAVIAPDFDALRPHAAANGWDVSSDAKLASLPQVRTLLMREINELVKEAKLKGFEVPKAFHVEGSVNELGQGFTIENDCLTPTFKLKRPALQRRYQAQINEMYESLGEGEVAKLAAVAPASPAQPAAPVEPASPKTPVDSPSTHELWHQRKYSSGKYKAASAA
jgi:long-chain acyl-CoA synthetase